MGGKIYPALMEIQRQKKNDFWRLNWTTTSIYQMIKLDWLWLRERGAKERESERKRGRTFASSTANDVRRNVPRNNFDFPNFGKMSLLCSSLLATAWLLLPAGLDGSGYGREGGGREAGRDDGTLCYMSQRGSAYMPVCKVPRAKKMLMQTKVVRLGWAQLSEAIFINWVCNLVRSAETYLGE